MKRNCFVAEKKKLCFRILFRNDADEHRHHQRSTISSQQEDFFLKLTKATYIFVYLTL